MSVFKKIVSSLTGENMEEKEPVQMFRRNGLYFKNVPSKGRGVFCTEDIKEGDIIEVTPLLVFNEADAVHIYRTLLKDYAFSASGMPVPPAPLEQPQRQGQSKATCVSMGMTSFCNHLVDPNADKIWMGDDLALYSALKAIKDIPAGTEICINYGIAWFTLHKKM